MHWLFQSLLILCVQQLKQQTVTAQSNTHNDEITLSSIEKYCGSGNFAKELILEVQHFIGDHINEVKFPTLHIQSAQSYSLTLNGDIKDYNNQRKSKSVMIDFHNRRISLGYYCRNDGAIQLTLGAMASNPLAIGLRQVWDLYSSKRWNTNNGGGSSLKTITFKIGPKTNRYGRLTLKMGLYRAQCREECRRSVQFKITNPSKWVLFRDLRLIPTGISDEWQSAGESCEPLTSLMIGSDDNSNNNNNHHHRFKKLEWNKGEHDFGDGVFVKVSEMDSKLCLLVKRQLPWTLIMFSILLLFSIMFAVYVFKLRWLIYPLEEYHRIEGAVEDLLHAKILKDELDSAPIGTAFVCDLSFNPEGPKQLDYDEDGYRFISVRKGEIVRLVERIDDDTWIVSNAKMEQGKLPTFILEVLE